MIVIPSRTDLVLVSGEVRLPQAVVYLQGAPVEHYIAAAGGFTDRAQEDPLLVNRQSGETITGRDDGGLEALHGIVNCCFCACATLTRRTYAA